MKRARSHYRYLASIALTLMLVVAACGDDDAQTTTTAAAATTTQAATTTEAPTTTEAASALPVVGFMFPAPPEDAGWNHEHDRARQSLEQTYPGLETISLVSPESDAASGLDQLVAQGAELIIAASAGYGDTLFQKSEEYPDVKFEWAGGWSQTDNLAAYYHRSFETEYFLGMLAGSLTETDVLGYIVPFPLEIVIRDVNAWALGAQSVNPDVTVKTIIINSWFDPPAETQAAATLIAEGADVLFGYVDSPAYIEEAESQGVYAIGITSDWSEFGPNAHLSSAIINFGPYLTRRVQEVVDGTWAPEFYEASLAEGTMALAPYGPAVPADVAEMVDQAVADFLAGDLDLFIGPIADQSGEVRVSDGQVMTYEEVAFWSWYVEGVEGELLG